MISPFILCTLQSRRNILTANAAWNPVFISAAPVGSRGARYAYADRGPEGRLADCRGQVQYVGGMLHYVKAKAALCIIGTRVRLIVRLMA
jgi:hypothetical protein